MAKVKFMVVSGFLGAGKTMLMIALSEEFEKRSKKASIITNDLGAKNLVDAGFTTSSGRNTAEITGGCICYQTENLVGKIRKFRDSDKSEIVMSDIPGCGVGALDHVYHTLRKEYGEEFDLMPFIVVADPERLRMIMPEDADINLSEEMKYLFDAQLKEADAIVLNKIDLLSDVEVESYRKFLEEEYGGVPVFTVSALEKTNVDKLADYVYSNKASMKVVDIGYGGKEFIEAESKLSWYNRRFYAKTADGSEICFNPVVGDLYREIDAGLRLNNGNVPHLKMMVHGKGDDASKSSQIGIDYDVEYAYKLREKSDSARFVVNARAACDSTVLGRIMDDALSAVAKKHGLECKVYFTECFGMTDPGIQ